jgi:rhamnogalacturonyl hydrolase YesR
MQRDRKRIIEDYAVLAVAVLMLPLWGQLASQAAAAAVPARISGEIAPEPILATMKAVADWQLAQPPRRLTDDWTVGALFSGMMALSQVSDDPKYHDAMMAMGRKQEWKPAKRVYDADDHCVCQTYLELYFQHRDPAMLGPTKERFDYVLANPKTNELRFVKGARDRWAWCDALFMGPPAWLRLYAATSGQKYLDFMDREWWVTSDYLYDKGEHLYFRDSTYFDKREANGKKVFWSRGNGWVLAGLARVLQVMPPEYPHRKLYQQQYREMAAKAAALQQDDGLWRASLLDPESYPLKETSGSGFYTFALAWGINRGVLDRATYEPVVRKAWQGLVACVTPEGKLEHVQPVGADPKKFEPTHSDVYGVGAFLLAASEMYRLALSELPAAAYGTFMPQRKDDFAWENDRIAHRAYGPALEATGEITSGIDVWVKRVRKPVIEKWYYLAAYHKDQGEGLDMYKVGPSRGCGGSGIWRDGKLYVANNFVTWRSIQNGPARVAFELGYAPYDAGGVKVRETRRISLETGSNLSRIETRLDWEGGPEELQAVVGIVKREGGGAPDFAKDGSWMAYWEPEQRGNGAIGCGVVMTAAAKPLDTPEQAFLQATVKRGQLLVYYEGAGWTKSGDFPDKESWLRYISQSGAKLNSK